MRELRLLGRHGPHLRLSDSDDAEYSLPISDELREALRNETAPAPQSAAMRPPVPAEPLRPKDIQQMLRAGATVEDVCALSGLPEQHVRRFEGPILAERAWTIQRAQSFPVGHRADSPTLGDMVIDRLATRQVHNVEWSATRETTNPWHVSAHYTVGGSAVVAQWEVNLSTRSVRALDDESRWLSETDASSPRSRRHFESSILYDVEDDGSFTPAEAEPEDTTDSFLEQLQSNRGVRHGEDDLLSEILSLEDRDVPAAHPPLSDPSAATDAQVLPLPARRRPARSSSEENTAGVEPEGQRDVEQPVERRPRTRGRRSVPSWDEIVFGSHPE